MQNAQAAQPPGRARTVLNTPQLVFELFGDAVADVGAALGLLRIAEGRDVTVLQAAPFSLGLIHIKWSGLLENMVINSLSVFGFGF